MLSAAASGVISDGSTTSRALRVAWRTQAVVSSRPGQRTDCWPWARRRRRSASRPGAFGRTRPRPAAWHVRFLVEASNGVPGRVDRRFVVSGALGALLSGFSSTALAIDAGTEVKSEPSPDGGKRLNYLEIDWPQEKPTQAALDADWPKAVIADVGSDDPRLNAIVERTDNRPR